MTERREPSEAAKRRARELLRCDPRGIGDGYGKVAEWITDALARVLQEHSDVAKREKAYLEADHGAYAKGSRLADLQSLILDDEPDPLDKFAKWLNGCSKDGKKLQEAAAMFGLKIVQSDASTFTLRHTTSKPHLFGDDDD